MFSTQVNVKAAHFGARMLKRRPPGGGATPNRTQMWLFQGVKVDEIGWNFHGKILTSRLTFSSRIHSPGPLALWVSMQKPCVQVERLLASVKQQEESDRVTIWQVYKTHQQIMHSRTVLSFSDLIRLSSSKCGSPHQDLNPTIIDEFCIPVKLSPCRSLLVASLKLAASLPGHRVFACLLIAPEDLGTQNGVLQVGGLHRCRRQNVPKKVTSALVWTSFALKVFLSVQYIAYSRHSLLFKKSVTGLSGHPVLRP